MMYIKGPSQPLPSFCLHPGTLFNLGLKYMVKKPHKKQQQIRILAQATKGKKPHWIISTES